jgi:hypothetical protein
MALLDGLDSAFEERHHHGRPGHPYFLMSGYKGQQLLHLVHVPLRGLHVPLWTLHWGLA